MIKVNQLDCTGATLFCSLDVHKLSWRVSIDDAKLELKDYTPPPDAQLLHKHLAKIILVQNTVMLFAWKNC